MFSDEEMRFCQTSVAMLRSTDSLGHIEESLEAAFTFQERQDEFHIIGPDLPSRKRITPQPTGPNRSRRVSGPRRTWGGGDLNSPARAAG